MKTIAWDQQKRDDFHAAYEAARQAGATEFTFIEKKGEGRFATKVAEHSFSLERAKDTLRFIDEAFERNRKATLPPNREGEEGQ